MHKPFEIKPCPACQGSEARLNSNVQRGPYVYRAVECTCGTRGPTVTKPDLAIQRWNEMPRRMVDE